MFFRTTRKEEKLILTKNKHNNNIMMLSLLEYLTLLVHYNKQGLKCQRRRDVGLPMKLKSSSISNNTIDDTTRTEWSCLKLVFEKKTIRRQS